MKVKELIEALGEVNPELVVVFHDECGYYEVGKPVEKLMARCECDRDYINGCRRFVNRLHGDIPVIELEAKD
jgi:hypothetical protein